jgi:hypothetical protein
MYSILFLGAGLPPFRFARRCLPQDDAFYAYRSMFLPVCIPVTRRVPQASDALYAFQAVLRFAVDSLFP